MNEEEEKEWERVKQCLAKKISPCCGVSISESHVIREGPHKGHGPRFCSKCHEIVFMV